MKIGFVGLGKMGQAMARLLIEDGHTLLLFNRTRAKAEALATQGASVAGSIADAAAGADVVITMLSDDQALLEATHGEGGLLAALPAGGVHMAMGTHAPGAIRDLAAAHAAAGQFLICAPMLGRPDAVAARQASVVAAGPAAAFERVRPILNSLGRRVFEAGEEPQAAATMKIANNFLLGCAIEALGEAFSLIEKWGGSSATFRQMIANGMFASPAYEAYAGIIAEKRFDQAGFTATLGLKDANLALAAGALAGVPLPSGNVWRDQLISAIAHGHADHDWATMALSQARACGLPSDRSGAPRSPVGDFRRVG